MARIWLDQILDEPISINVESIVCLKIGFFIYLFVFSLHATESSHSEFLSVFKKHTEKSINFPRTHGIM